METETIFDYASLVVALSGKDITITRQGKVVYTLTPALVESEPTALLRVGVRVSFYRVVQTADMMADDVAKMLMTVMPQLDGGLFYVFGHTTVKTRRTKGKSCRAVSLGTTQIAFRDQGLVFNTLTTRTLGNVVLDDTGDTMPLYAQLNSLI